MPGQFRRGAINCGELIWLRFAQLLANHNAEFNPHGALEPSRKRSIVADSVKSKRQKLEGLEEADLAELMKAGPVSMTEHRRYILLLARPTTKDSAGALWIASKHDMNLDTDEVLFAFGSGRRHEHC
jgi:hypothetical protein